MLKDIFHPSISVSVFFLYHFSVIFLGGVSVSCFPVSWTFTILNADHFIGDNSFHISSFRVCVRNRVWIFSDGRWHGFFISVYRGGFKFPIDLNL